MSVWLLGYVAVAGWVVVLMYATRPWWRSGVGINFMSLSVALAVCFTLLAFGGDGAWRIVVWHVLIGALGLVLTHRAVLVGLGIRHDRRERVR